MDNPFRNFSPIFNVSKLNLFVIIIVSWIGFLMPKQSYFTGSLKIVLSLPGSVFRKSDKYIS